MPRRLLAAHGWQRVTLTGSRTYRDAVASACAMREPPLSTDHPLSKVAADQVAAALRDRAASRVPALDMAAVRQLADLDPAAAAVRVVEHTEARARAALSGEPTGTRNPRDLSQPRIADLIARRDESRDDAREASTAASAHRAAHPWGARLLDGAVRRRQAALDDAEAVRLDDQARRLDRGHDKSVRSIEKEARREATANTAAHEDWKWSAPVRKAQAQLDHMGRVRAAVVAGDAKTLAAAAGGDLRAAAQAAAAHQAKPVQTTDPRTAAVRQLAAAEQQHAADPAALARARSATAAAVAGDVGVITAVSSGDLEAVWQAAAAWQAEQSRQAREQQEERARQLAAAVAKTPQEPAQPTM